MTPASCTHCDHRRYFIELQPEGTEPVSRRGEVQARREQATHFITTIYDWLKNHALDDKVSDMDVTAFGQIRITCEVAVIDRIRDEDVLNIAVIRPSAQYIENMGQLGRMR
jgi:hypothetical protein